MHPLPTQLIQAARIDRALLDVRAEWCGQN
jgi:hypothetical protein